MFRTVHRSGEGILTWMSSFSRLGFFPVSKCPDGLRSGPWGDHVLCLDEKKYKVTGLWHQGEGALVQPEWEVQAFPWCCWVPPLRRVIVRLRIDTQGSQSWELLGAHSDVVFLAQIGQIYNSPLHLWELENCEPFWREKCKNQLINTYIWISTAFTRELICFVGCLALAGRISEQHQHGQGQGRQEWKMWWPHTTWVAGHSFRLPPCVLRTDSDSLWRRLSPTHN